MIHNEINLKVTDVFCKYTNKIFPNNLNDEYLTKPLKRIIAFNTNYKELTHKEFYVLYDINGNSQPYCVDYKEDNKLIQHNTFADLKLAIECYNNIDLWNILKHSYY